ncbi:MAG: hypothetical protein AAF348_10000 [Bacteroidota bacterium]
METTCKSGQLMAIIMMVVILQACKPSRHFTYKMEPPGTAPELFAPSLVNTDAIEINAVFNPTFTELFFTRIIDGSFIIHHTKIQGDGNWSKPEPIQMYADGERESVAIDPSITQNGKTMYFLGISPEDRSKNAKPDIYKSHKVDGKWQRATRVGYPVSTDDYAESYPVVVADGSIYFTSDRPGGLGKRDIYKAQYLGEGKFDKPVNIGPEVNSKKSERSTYVSPDEHVLVTGNNYTEEKGFAVSFKKNGRWQRPSFFDLGETLSKDWIYFCPYMSPDGKYFFFSKRYSDPPDSGWKGVAKGEVYWMDAKRIIGRQR